MTLASAFLIFGISLGIANIPYRILAQSDPQSGTTTSSASDKPDQQDSSSPAKAKPSQSSKIQTAKPPVGAHRQTATTKKTVSKKKKTVPPSCDPTPNNNPTATEIPDSVPDAPANTSAPVQPSSTTAPKNCPPSKIIVRQGGINEQSIQLAGGASGDQAVQKRESATQLLAATDANLKKIAGIQLSPAQQDSVSQIRQFVTQSKTAIASGDMERAHTLAWKAQVLSEDLVNPKK